MYDFRKQESSSKLCAVCFIARWCHQTWTHWAFKVYLECEILLACLFTICAKLLQKKKRRFVLLWEATPVWSKGRMCTPCPVYLRHCELYGFNFCDWQMQKQIEATNVPRYQSLRHGIGDTVQQRRNMGNWSVVQGDQWSRLGTLKGLWSLSDPKQSYPRERNRQKTIYWTSKRK